MSDATNLYGYAQLQALPHRDFVFLNDGDVRLFTEYFSRRSVELKKGRELPDYKTFFRDVFEEEEKDLNDDEQLMFFVEADFR